MRCHGFLAVADPRPEHQCRDQASHTRVDMHHGAAREVQYAQSHMKPPSPDHTMCAIGANTPAATTAP